jgi:hypothetical protein
MNAIGRAGRATKETEGVVVLARPAAPDPDDFERLSPKDADIHVTSALATQQALEELAVFEQMQRSAEDAVFQTASSLVSDFVKFVWFVAAELERLQQLPSKDCVAEVLERTLAWLQLGPLDRDRWLSVVQTVLDRYVRTDPRARRRWAEAGTAISSAEVLESIAREIAEALGNTEVPQDPADVVGLILGEGRLERLLRLPEAPDRRIFTQRGGRNRVEIRVPMEDFARKWLQGSTLIALSDSFLGSVKDVSFRFEQLGDFINDYFEIFFPWVFGTMIAWVNGFLEQRGVESLLPKTVPAGVRWGVADETALGLMINGIRSRRLAMRISEAWKSETTSQDVYSWTRSMSLAEWQHAFNASPPDLRNLLEFSRDRRGGVAVELVNAGVVELEVVTDVSDLPEREVALAKADNSEFSSICIWLGQEQVGCIESCDQVDVEGILESGIMLVITFSASSGKGTLRLQLADPGV